MPVQTRAKAPTDRVYSSPAALQQVRFRAGKQNVTYRRTLGASHRSRQQTLTQIDFVNLQEAFDQDDDDDRYVEYREEEQKNRHKRRRTDVNGPSSSSNFYTQTLTQLEFVSTPESRFEESADMENNFDDDSTILKHEPSASPFHKMRPPKTPSRRRVYEVPSSQSPFSPISARSQRFSNTRSPLKALDVNLQRQSLSPIRHWGHKRSPSLKIKIEDTFEYENESQQSRVPQTPGYISSPTKIANSSEKLRVRTSTQRLFRDEIRDSDEDDDDLDSCDDIKVQESRVDPCCKSEHSSQLAKREVLNFSPSDTQEADNQLKNTILQFTQNISSTAAAAEDEEGQNHTPFIRPSQATTVSQSQPITSSPIFWRRPNEYLSLQEETFPDNRDVDQDQERNTIGEEGFFITAIPDSPSQRPTSDSSWHSQRIRRPQNHQHHQAPFAAQHHQQQQNHVPTSASYASSSPPIKISRPQPIISSSATTAAHSDLNQNQKPNTSSPMPQPFSLLPSSQILMTRSQMLPDSLMNASVPPPPSLKFLIEDSETESDFEEY